MVQRLSDQDPAPKDLIRSGLNLAGFQPIHKYGTQIAIFLELIKSEKSTFSWNQNNSKRTGQNCRHDSSEGRIWISD